MSLNNTDSNTCVMYLENYLNCVENLPDDAQKHLTRLREIDVFYQNFLRDIESLGSQYECVLRKDEDKSKLERKLETILISAQELGDEKLQIVQQLQDLIDNKTRLLDQDYKNIDNGSKEREPVTIMSVSASSANHSSDSVFKEQLNSLNSNNNHGAEQRQSKRVRRGRGDDSGSVSDYGTTHLIPHHYGEHSGSIPMPRVSATLIINSQKKNKDCNAGSAKKKKRKTSKQSKLSLSKDDDRNSKNAIDDDDDQSIDPDEPRYCLCDQISYGEMIGCDNDLCPIEWFHFRCVSLSTKPKGKWFCPKCRGDRPNVMKPKAQFLKELERFNREKEEKARSY